MFVGLRKVGDGFVGWVDGVGSGVGMGWCERWVSEDLEFERRYGWFIGVVGKMAGLG